MNINRFGHGSKGSPIVEWKIRIVEWRLVSPGTELNAMMLNVNLDL